MGKGDETQKETTPEYRHGWTNIFEDGKVKPKPELCLTCGRPLENSNDIRCDMCELLARS